MSLERIAELIRLAGQSRAGFFTLVLVFLSGVLIAIFDDAPPIVRLAAYCGVAFGVAAFSWLAYRASLLPPGAVLMP